jgi:hypothetical protein
VERHLLLRVDEVASSRGLSVGGLGSVTRRAIVILLALGSAVGGFLLTSAAQTSGLSTTGALSAEATGSSLGGGPASHTPDSADEPPAWLRKDGSVDYSKVPDRIELLVPGGELVGYVDSEVVFDENAPAVVRPGEADPNGDEADGPFPVYSDMDGEIVVGQYFRSIGFVPQDIYESPEFDADTARAKIDSPTTTTGE